MSTLVKRQQIARTYLEAYQLATGFTTAGGVNDDITATLGTLATADSVPVQVAVETAGSEAMGYVLNKQLQLWDSTSKSAISDGAGNEVYAKITKPSSVYLLNYYSLVAGAETAYSMAASASVDFAPIYFYNDLKLPVDAFTRVKAIEVGEDPINRSVEYSELLSVTATNTLSDLSTTPVDGSKVTLLINGLAYDSVDGSVSTSGTEVTWNFTAGSGGFDIATTGYTVEAVYKIYA